MIKMDASHFALFLLLALFVTSQTLPNDVRLPRTVLPRHYDVRLFPILEKDNFTILGQVSIDLECNKDTNRIVLHSADIVVDPQSVQVIERHAITDKFLQVEGIEFDTELEFLVVRLNPNVKLSAGSNYTLSMSFVGNLTDQMRGFYRSVYTEDGTERFMASSQMEPTEARRALPCFDEPNLKAIFTVTLGRHRDMISLSNMPKILTTPMIGMENFFWDHFESSVPMSTYLLAFAVANYTQVPSLKTNAKWNFNIYARSSAYNQTRYASDIGPRILSFFEDYFKISFPLPKQDMIAIPDFPAGAMENWGLITYKEKFLLYDDTVSSVDNRELVIKVIAHELSHQWFGNLVTMDWWTDLWLNEGFATFVEQIGADHVEPSFKFLEQIVTFALQQSMNDDALESSHPVSVVVQNPSEIGEIFDSISYQKGASIIRMLANFIGEENFKKALFYYLDKRQYGNAMQDDLWNALDRQANAEKVVLPANVKTVMDTWTLKMGFPVVTVRRDYQSRNVSISQERFLLHKSKNVADDTVAYLWWIPLTYTTDFKTIGSTWLADNQSSKNLTLESKIGEDDWIIFNVNETGYYRVNYDAHNWKLIDQQLMTNHTAISVINRAQIMNDALNLARVGLLDYDTAFHLTEYLKLENEYLPWEATLNALTYIDSMMWQKPGYDLLQKHFRNIMSPIFSSLGFRQKSNDSPLTSKLRLLIVKWACYYGNEECIQEAVDLYRQWMADPENPLIIPVDVKSVVISTAIGVGDETEWQFAFDRFTKSNVAHEKDRLLSALTSTREHTILKRILEMILNSTSEIRQQDAPDAVVSMSQNHFSRPILFNFIKENWNQVKSSFSVFDALSRIIRSATSSIHTDQELKEFVKFRDEQGESLKSVTRSVQQTMDSIAGNIDWIKFHHLNVVDWLQRQNQISFEAIP